MVNSKHHSSTFSDHQITQLTEPTDHLTTELDMPLLRVTTARGLQITVPTCGWISMSRNEFHA